MNLIVGSVGGSSEANYRLVFMKIVVEDNDNERTAIVRAVLSTE